MPEPKRDAFMRLLAEPANQNPFERVKLIYDQIKIEKDKTQKAQLWFMLANTIFNASRAGWLCACGHSGFQHTFMGPCNVCYKNRSEHTRPCNAFKMSYWDVQQLQKKLNELEKKGY